MDTGETGNAGTLVYADLNHNGQFTAGDPFTYTIAGGAYTLSNLPAGTYSIGVAPPADYRLGNQESAVLPITIGSNSGIRLDLGLVHRLIAAIPVQVVPNGQSLSLALPLTSTSANHKLRFQSPERCARREPRSTRSLESSPGFPPLENPAVLQREHLRDRSVPANR